MDGTDEASLIGTITLPCKKVAIDQAINYDESTKRILVLGDSALDSRRWMRSALPDRERDLMQEVEHEYGTRVGIWRLLRILNEFDAPYSVSLSSEALLTNPEPAEKLETENYDIVSHRTRSIGRFGLPEDAERADLYHSIDQTLELTGKKILGAFPRPPITENSRRITAEEGLLFDSVTKNDDRPYFDDVARRPMLNGSTDIFDYLKDAFDVLYRESDDSVTMISIGLHARIMRPGRAASIIRFLGYVSSFNGTWVAKRSDITAHFTRQFAQLNMESTCHFAIGT
ncbi:hypothetical protein N0V90_006220 [Kalmusia sp. IMI 367209]|nr:hypothetical protein N0V90_006220 [Kalmusia sp. IMI 367209]